MPRSFWYIAAIALVLSAFSTLRALDRGTYQENVLFGVFSAPGAGPSPAGIVCMFGLLAIAALITMRITGGARTHDSLGLFALALFVPFTFLASRFWGDTLAILLLTGAVLSSLEPARGARGLALAFVLVALSVIARGQLAWAPFAIALYLALSRRAKAGIVFAALFAAFCLAVLRFDIGAAGEMRRGPELSGLRDAYSMRGLADVFSWSLEIQLLSAFMPFLVAAWAGLTVKGLPQDRAALFLVLSLSFLPLLVLPAVASDAQSARVLFMTASVFTILGANSGASLLSQPMAGMRSLRWEIAVAAVILLPSIFSCF